MVFIAGSFSASAVVSELDWSTDNGDSEVWGSGDSIDCVIATGLNAIDSGSTFTSTAYAIQPI